MHVSPCEHGIHHHILEIPEGAEFWIPECKDGRGRQRYHKATRDKYNTNE